MKHLLWNHKVATLISQPAFSNPFTHYKHRGSIFSNIGQIANDTWGNGNANGFYNCTSFGSGAIEDDNNPYQTAGGGNYYLADNTFRGQGSGGLAEIQQKTTYPPTVYSGGTISDATSFSPQAQRDTAASDLGYHYDPIDYLVDELAVTNATLTITNGAVIASGNDTGILLHDGSTLVSQGTPLLPNWFVRYSSVQEQPLSTTPSTACDVLPAYSAAAPDGEFRFTKFACPAGGGWHLYHQQFGGNYGNLLLQDCEFWGGANSFGGTTNSAAILRNNLFARSTILATNDASSRLSLTNNLFLGVASVFLCQTNSSAWSAYNNAFDSCVIPDFCNLTNGYNAYLNCSGRLYPTNAHDIVAGDSVAWQSGPLGGFYLPTDSRLVDAGCATADQIGLYHYTTQTNQVKETNSIVDIGYHYVAVDDSGNPIVSNTNWVPDYLADANGNGLWDTGEIPWGLVPIINSQPADQTITVGNNASFSITASGTLPMGFQWSLNGTNIPGATNTTLTLSGVQFNQAGDYTVLATNMFGSTLSFNAALTVVGIPPTVTLQPNNQAAVIGGQVSFSVTASGTPPLIYQWSLNGTNIVGATNATLTLTDVQFTQAGNYSVLVSNIWGSVFSSNAILTVGHSVIIGWGNNSFGQINIPVGLTNVLAIAAGGNHSLALKADGTVVAWGYDNYGQTNIPAGLSNVVAIAGGTFHSLALKADGRVIAWGNDFFGQTDVPPDLTNVTAIAGGWDHSLALKADGTVVAWGSQTNVPAGLTNAVAIAAGQSFCLVLKADGTVVGWGAINIPSGLTNIVAIAANDFNSLALKGDGTVTNWGSQTNVPVGLTNAVAIAAGFTHGLALRADGTVVTWGSQTNVPAGLTNVIAIAGGGSGYSLALINDGTPAIAVQPHIRLGYWPFDDTNTWMGSAGQLPLVASNVVGVPSWSSNAVIIDCINSAMLGYRDVETNGHANINLANGTIRFWFKPDWSSPNSYHTDQEVAGRLIEMGNYNPAFTNGWWALYLNYSRNQLSFGSSTNGNGTTNLSAGFYWTSDQWHQIVLTYTPTNSLLYLDGQLAASGSGSIYYPNITERTDGFRIGSDKAGTNQAQGVFDELETFNYPLSDGDIQSNYQAAITLDSDGDGMSNILENQLGLDPYGYNSANGLNSINRLQVFTPLK